MDVEYEFCKPMKCLQAEQPYLVSIMRPSDLRKGPRALSQILTASLVAITMRSTTWRRVYFGPVECGRLRTTLAYDVDENQSRVFDSLIHYVSH